MAPFLIAKKQKQKTENHLPSEVEGISKQTLGYAQWNSRFSWGNENGEAMGESLNRGAVSSALSSPVKIK